VLSLSKTTGQGPETLAKGLYDIVSSGFKANDGLKILNASAKAATAGLTDTATAVTAVTAVLNSYHLGADKAKAVSDVLFETVNKGVLNFQELASQIGDVLPAASSLGVPLTEVGGALATVTLHGVSAAEAATQVKQVLVSMLKPSNDLQGEFKKLGYESAQSALQQKGLTGVITDLSKAAAGNQTTIAGWFPNVRALSGFMGLAGKNIGQFTDNVRAMDNASKGAGATQRAFAEQAKSISFQWQQAKASLAAAAIPLGQILFPALVKAARAVAFLAEQITQHMPQIRAVTQAAVRGIAQAWNQYGSPAFDAIRARTIEVAAVVRRYWPTVSAAVRNAASGAAASIRQAWPQIEAATRQMAAGVRAAITAARAVIAALAPTVRALAPAFRSAMQIIASSVRAGSAIATAAFHATAAAARVLGPVIVALAPVVNAAMALVAAAVRMQTAVIVGALGAITAAIHAVASAWDALRAAASHAIHFVATVSMPNIPGVGAVKHGIGSVIHAIPHAAGGLIPLDAGQRGRDSVPAMLTPGEMVLNQAQQAALGGTAYLARMFGFSGGGVAGGTQFFAAGGIATGPRPIGFKPRRRRPGSSPPARRGHRARRTGNFDSRVAAMSARIAGVDDDIEATGREYSELADRYSVDDRNLEFIGSNPDGTEYVDQAAVDQRSNEIQKLLAKDEELRALYERKARLLAQMIALLIQAIRAAEARIKEEKRRIAADQKEIKALQTQIYQESLKKKVKTKVGKKTVTTGGPNQTLLKQWRHRLGEIRHDLSGQKSLLSKDTGLLGNFQGDLTTGRHDLRFNAFDIRDNVNSDEYRLRGELADIDPSALQHQVDVNNQGLTASGGAGAGGAGNPDLQALLAALTQQLAQANLALGVQGIQIPLIGAFERGTIHVPETGPYLLHAGEKVTQNGVPAGVGGDGGSIGDIEIVLRVDDPSLRDLIRVEAVNASSDISVRQGQEVSRRVRGGRF
jgi:TP901 family phage tail tape measure protein